ncbi:cytochrome C biogenesis protein [Azoarcus sp. DN11]|nr:cytochrome c-type biogenesis protein [Azoarcus sp. DN11]AYH42035.1 cytochrome C biogenesis protein [Azoarcus sp. DN11]
MRRLALVAALLLPVAGHAGEAAPVTNDPALEERVMRLAHDLRCLVCQNQSIAESNAPLAVDLRDQVREQFLAGKDEAAVVDYLVARYGDFVLYLPPFKGITLLLWLGPGLLLVAGAGWLVWRLRSRVRETPHALSAEEHARAAALLDGTAKPSQESRS